MEDRSSGVVKPNPIAVALKHWPKSRFPEDSEYERYWVWTFRDQDPQLVADAINALAMETDPHTPTIEAVKAIMGRLGLREEQPAWDRIEYERVRDEGLAIEREQKANRELCDQLSDEDFARIAREHIALFDKDVRDLPCYSVLKTPAQLRKSNYLTSLVAAHARAHGLVKSRVLEGVL